MKIVITGGCGLLGSNIAAYWLKEKAQVLIIDNLSRKGSEANKKWLLSVSKLGQLSVLAVDTAETAPLKDALRAFAPFDLVCHLAGQVAMTTSIQDPLRDFRTNALGTLNVLEAVRNFSPDALVTFSSTNKVYGDMETLRYEETASRYVAVDYPNGFDESTPLDFASPYGCSKGCADQYVRDWCRNYGLKTVVFRHSSIYGSRQYATFDQGWVGWFCQQALEQKAAVRNGNAPALFTVSGTGKQVRDLLHVEDLVSLYAAAYTFRSTASGRIYNIGGGMKNSLSLIELFSLLSNYTGTKLTFTHLPPRKSDQKVFVADTSAAAKDLHWKPSITRDEGVNRMLGWCESILPSVSV
jgi:CDP-paratose 2-epimerase